MLNNQTLEKLVSMKLSSMGKEYRRQLESPDTTALSFEERFGMLVDAEWTSRHNSRLNRLLRLANLRIQGACLEETASAGVISTGLSSTPYSPWG